MDQQVAAAAQPYEERATLDFSDFRRIGVRRTNNGGNRKYGIADRRRLSPPLKPAARCCLSVPAVPESLSAKPDHTGNGTLPDRVTGICRRPRAEAQSLLLPGFIGRPEGGLCPLEGAEDPVSK
ncbi:unnamed protein product [Calypogeia fissa]